MADDLDLATVLTWTKELAAEAAARAISLKTKEINVREKPDGSLVTDIDRTLERFIRDEINARFPEHAILGEEFGGAGQTSEAAPLWAIDPIDGTTNMSHGLPLWGISIGLVVGGLPAVGVVAFPEIRETYSAARGLGAALNDTPLKTLAPGGPLAQEDAYGVCTTGIHKVNYDRFPARLRVFGSAALDYCWAAAGRVNGAQTIGVALYDIAAALCVANEVGAETRWLRTGELFSADALAASGGVEDDALIVAPSGTMSYLRATLTMKDA